MYHKFSLINRARLFLESFSSVGRIYIGLVIFHLSLVKRVLGYLLFL